MPKYVIERELPRAGDLSAEELQGISQTSCGVPNEMGPQIQLLHSQVTGRQDLLHLHRPERGHDPPARRTGRLPGDQGLRGPLDHRPDHRGGVGEAESPVRAVDDQPSAVGFLHHGTKGRDMFGQAPPLEAGRTVRRPRSRAPSRLLRDENWGPVAAVLRQGPERIAQQPGDGCTGHLPLRTSSSARCVAARSAERSQTANCSDAPGPRRSCSPL